MKQEAAQSKTSGNDSNGAARPNQPNPDYSNTVKNPDDWTTGGEPITGAQQSYLSTLASEAGEELDSNLTKAEASKKIEELQHKTGRGIGE